MKIFGPNNIYRKLINLLLLGIYNKKKLLLKQKVESSYAITNVLVSKLETESPHTETKRIFLIVLFYKNFRLLLSKPLCHEATTAIQLKVVLMP